MFANVIIFCLVLLVIALVLKCRANAQDIETLYDMIRAVQNLPPRKPSGPQPDATDAARREVERHEASFHNKR